MAEQHRDDAEIFVPIGSNGFFIEGNEKARFDQQPVEACATVSACLEVYRLTEESIGLRRPSASSAGFSARTTCRCRFMMRQQAAAGTAFIPTASMKTRERNQRFHS